MNQTLYIPAEYSCSECFENYTHYEKIFVFSTF